MSFVIRHCLVVVILAAAMLGCGKDGRPHRVPLTRATEEVPLELASAPPASQPAKVSLTATPVRRGVVNEDADAPPKPSRPQRVDLAEGPDDQEAAAPAPTDKGELKVLGSPQVVTGAVIQVNRRFFSVDDILKSASFELTEIPHNLSEQEFRLRAAKIINDETRHQVSQALALPEAEKVFSDEQKKLIDKEIDETLQEMISRSEGSKKKLESKLQSQGTTLAKVLEDQRRKLTVQYFLRMKFTASVNTNRLGLWEYYSRHQEEFTTPKRVQMQIVSVPLKAYLAPGATNPTEAELAAARVKAEAQIALAVKALHSGEDFGQVAEKYSVGPKGPAKGLWQPLAEGSFREEAVEKVAFAQGGGQVSDIVDTPTGCYIVKTAAVEPASTTSFEDAQPKIEKILREQQLSKLYNEYYSALIAKATIVQSENFVSMTVDRAVERYWNK
ncbi:MAG: peptidyl-prolyl cis-trans isomerase [Phycisphaerae bacterium]